MSEQEANNKKNDAIKHNIWITNRPEINLSVLVTIKFQNSIGDKR